MAKHYRHKNIVRWRLRGRLLGVHRHLHYERGEQDRRKKPDHAFALSNLRWSGPMVRKNISCWCDGAHGVVEASPGRVAETARPRRARIFASRCGRWLPLVTNVYD